MSIETTRGDIHQDALRSPEECAAVIEAVIEEAADGPAFITLVLGEVVRSRGMAQTARDAGLRREGLYKALTPAGNPSFATVLEVLAALGLRMHLAPARETWRFTQLYRCHASSSQTARMLCTPTSLQEPTMVASFPKFRSFPGARLVGAALLIAVLGSITLSAWAMPGGHGGGSGMGMMMNGRGLERMLDSVNATAEQRTQIKAIAERTTADMKAQREAGKGTREQMMKLFAQPTVDANAAEALRAQMLQQHDQSSRRMMQAMLEVSRVLTPEQRKQITDLAAQRGAMMERHMNERRAVEGGTTTR